MNKKSFLFSCLLSLILSSIAQPKNLPLNDKRIGRFFNCIEDCTGNYLILGRTSPDGIFDFGYLRKISPTGDLLNELLFQHDGENSSFFKILSNNTSFIVLGNIYDEIGDDLLYMKLDSNLQIDEYKILKFPDNRHIRYSNAFIDSDSLIIISGYSFPSSGDYNMQPFLYQINTNGDSIQTKYFNNTNLQFLYQVHESSDSSKYLAFMDGYVVGYEISGILHLNKNFDIIKHCTLSSAYNYMFSSLAINDSLFLVTNLELSSPQLLKICIINENGYIKDYFEFTKSSHTIEYPAYSPGISQRNNFFYIGATSGFDLSNPFYSTNNSWFHLIKMDENMNVLWEKWYGGDAYYSLNSILATSDGGCLMVGTKYSHSVENQFIQGYYIKVDANGNEEWTLDVKIPEWSYKVYPNPTQSVFNIENNEMDIQSVELFDISGKLLNSVQDCNNTTISVDLSSFPPGIYLAKVKSSKGIRTEKVVRN